MRPAAQDILKVAGTNAGVLALVNLVDLKSALELALICLSIAFTIWRWLRAARGKIDNDF